MRRLTLIISVAAIGLAIAGYVFFNGERKVPVRYRTAAVEQGSHHLSGDCDRYDQSDYDRSGRQPGLGDDREPSC